MMPYIVFYADQVLEEMEYKPHSSLCPDSSYLYDVGLRLWYFHRWGAWTPINTVDVPNKLKMWLLVL